MTRRISTILILSLLALAFVAMSANAVKSPEESPRVINPLVNKSLQYAFPDASNIGNLNASPATELNDGVSLGNAVNAAPPWPGVQVGDTYYEYQHNGRMTRMVDWGNDVDGGEGFMVHFEWMRLPTEILENRAYNYNVYYAEGLSAGTFLGQTTIQPNGEYAGYVSLDVTQDGRAVLGGHNNQGQGYQNHTYWDFGPGFAFFGMNRRVHDSVSAEGTDQDWQVDSLKSCIWPSIRYHETPGKADPVLHCFTQVSEPGAGDAQAIIYFRKVGLNDTGEWDFPPFVVDTVFDIAQDVACSETTGKVALTWIANRPDDGDCDTCSSQSGQTFVQWDNDVYYQISNNYGAPGSWLPMVNLTMHVDGVDGYRPYTDMQALITDDNDLHIVWGSRFWPADANLGGQAGLLRGRVFHWGENLGFVKAAGNIRTAARLEYDQTECNGGAWQLNGSKMSVSECDGKLYVIWTQFNDPEETMEDCHNRAFGAGGDAFGSANGELYLAVSDDGGLTWDGARNLTNTRTPHCDSATGIVGECRSEHWSSMNRHGTNLGSGGNWGGAEVVDPTGSYGGSYFLDVQYMGDVDPGGVIQDEGTWQQASVQWFRLPCIEPVPTPGYSPSWDAIQYPEWTKHYTAYVKHLVIENPGNIATTFSTVINLDGPYTNWLVMDATIQAGTIPSGAGNTVEGDVTINGDLSIGGVPGTIIHLTGTLDASGNFGTFQYDIDFFIVDSIIPPVFDTITTGCFSLVISNMGNWGNQGAGQVNLDFFDYGDCDNGEPGTVEDTIPGDATVYAYDASPVICWPDGDSVICNWSIFGQGYLSDNGFYPMGHTPSVSYVYGYDCADAPDDTALYYDGAYLSEFVTRDTGILIQKYWIFPDQSGSQGSNWIIQILKITVVDGQTHDNLNIGEAIDWDIPADSASRNRSGFDASLHLIYQQGSEYDEDPEECMDNNNRYGGIELLEIVEIDGETETRTNNEYGAWTGSNALWVYPAGGYIPIELDSLMTAREGYVVSDSIDADLHSVMTFVNNYTLTPSKTIIIYKCLITSRLGYAAFIASAGECHDWYEANLVAPSCGCCKGAIRGNFDYSDPDTDAATHGIDISDLVGLVDYMFTGGIAPVCWSEADVDGSSGGESESSDIDISDLVALVDFMFTGGIPPAACQ